MALADTGRVYTWGSNNVGQLGHGDTLDRLVPTPVRRLWDLQVDMYILYMYIYMYRVCVYTLLVYARAAAVGLAGISI